MVLLIPTEIDVGIDLRRPLWRRASRGNARATGRPLSDGLLRYEVAGPKAGMTSYLQIYQGKPMTSEIKTCPDVSAVHSSTFCCDCPMSSTFSFLVSCPYQICWHCAEHVDF